MVAPWHPDHWVPLQKPGLPDIFPTHTEYPASGFCLCMQAEGKLRVSCLRYLVVGVCRLREGFVYTHYVNLLQVSYSLTSLWTLTFQFEFIAMLLWASNDYISALNICFANQNHNLFMSSLFFWFESSYPSPHYAEILTPHYAEILTICFIKIHLPLFKFLSIYVWHFYDYFS